MSTTQGLGRTGALELVMSTETAPHVVDVENAHYSFSSSEREELTGRLHAWYARSRRALPWRGDVLTGYETEPIAGQTSAYGTWVSEVMCQQTRIETVIPYWFRWMRRFPSVRVLAEATPEEVNTLWAGLGYYRRAQQLLAGAKEVLTMYGGSMPGTVEELRKIPGIGPYTAGAIASIAFGVAAPLVDGNVVRVFSRLRGIPIETGPALDKVCWRIAEQLVDAASPGDFNQGLMELGATVCKPTSPSCSACPLAQICVAHKAFSSSPSDSQDLAVTRFPVKSAKKPPKQLSYHVCVVVAADEDVSALPKYLFCKRPPKGLLANQWEFPCQEVSTSSLESKTAEEVWQSFKMVFEAELGWRSEVQMPMAVMECAAVTHVFSHQVHTMRVVRVTLNSKELVESTSVSGGAGIGNESSMHGRECRWMSVSEMTALEGITSGCKKVIDAVCVDRRGEEEVEVVSKKRKSTKSSPPDTAEQAKSKRSGLTKWLKSS